MHLWNARLLAMKIGILLAYLLSAISASVADTPQPLFEICRLNQKIDIGASEAERKPVYYFWTDFDSPLLKVYKVRALLLDVDKKNVGVLLNSSDARTVDEILFNHKSVCVADSQHNCLLLQTKFFTDQEMQFGNGALAATLRTRFHIDPSSNRPTRETPSSTVMFLYRFD